MHAALLVADQHVRQVGCVGVAVQPLQLGLQQGLTQPGDVAVTEDAEAAGEELLLDPVPLGILMGEEPDHRLSDGEPYGLGHL